MQTLLVVVLLLALISGAAVAKNLAFKRPATQSSTRSGAVSTRAVDGNANPGSCANTVGEKYKWWRVGLGTS